MSCQSLAGAIECLITGVKQVKVLLKEKETYEYLKVDF